MLRFRNTYKTSKKMLWEAVFSILSMFFMIITLGFAFFVPGYLRIFLIVICVMLYLTHVFLFYLLLLENNNYKLRYILQKKKFKKLCDEELSSRKVDYSNSDKRIILQNFKDSFLQFGTLKTPEQIKFEKSAYFLFMQDQKEFNYSNARDKEKFEYLLSTFYNGFMFSNSLLDIFKKWSIEPFTNDELTNILTKSEYFSEDLTSTMKKVVKAYDKYKEYNFSSEEIDKYYVHRNTENQLYDLPNERFEFLDYIELKLYDNIWELIGEIQILIKKLAREKYPDAE